MEDYPGNSRRPVRPTGPSENSAPSEGEGPQLKPVITGKVLRRKKPLGRRILDTFFRGDGGVINHLVKDVLVPALQATVTDLVTQGIERAVYGEVRSPRRTMARGTSRTHISYDRPNIITRPSLNQPSSIRRPATQTTSSMNIGEIVLETDFEAQMMIEELYETIRDYGQATVANLKQLLGESPTYVDHRWGWEDDAEFKVRRAREGFVVDYSDPRPLK